jgi:hypothetical protein
LYTRGDQTITSRQAASATLLEKMSLPRRYNGITSKEPNSIETTLAANSPSLMKKFATQIRTG